MIIYEIGHRHHNLAATQIRTGDQLVLRAAVGVVEAAV